MKKDLEAQGYFVMRSAGSHGPADIIPSGEGPCMEVGQHSDGDAAQSFW